MGGRDIVRKKVINILVGLSIFLLTVSYPFTASAASGTSIFKSKYPKQVIRVSKSVDLDKDRKPETVILTTLGYLYLVKGNKVTLVEKNIVSDKGFPAPKLTINHPAQDEYQVIIRLFYGASNTRAFVYRMQKGKLVKVLDVVGDVEIKIHKGKIYQVWKMYRDEGLWDPVTAVYSWNSKKQKFDVSGMVSN